MSAAVFGGVYPMGVSIPSSGEPEGLLCVCVWGGVPCGGKHIIIVASQSKTATARTSMLSRSGAPSAVAGSSKAECSERVAGTTGGPGSAQEPETDLVFHLKALLWESIMLLCPHPHLRSLPYCNTNARPLRNIRPPTDPSFVCHTAYNIGDGNIV